MGKKSDRDEARRAAALARAAGHSTIAAKLIAKLRGEARGELVDLETIVGDRAQVTSKAERAALHPAHAAYAYVQNQLSVLSEQLTALKELAPLADLISEAEDLYMPGGPPMSPLTTSYFTCWALFDACVGPSDETIGTIVMEVIAAVALRGELLRLTRLMQESRMGFYAHEGTAGELVVLRDLVTDGVCQAIVPAGYRGQRGELWYARVLPPPAAGFSEHVVFTTPYVVLKPDAPEWRAYFRRALAEGPAHARHMKYGPTRAYWNDFVFEAYVNHRSDVIFLAGLPDVPESRPHSPVNSARWE